MRLPAPAPDSPSLVRVRWSDYSGVLFDLDGVLTPTALVHQHAWAALFTDFLESWEGPGDTRPYTDQDYFDHVDGKPRFDGVRDFLTSRGIELPEGEDDADVSEESVRGLGNRKNEAFNAALATEGITAYAGSLRLLDHLEAEGVAMAVVSSSVNAEQVLRTAGIRARFPVVVGGDVAAREGLPGKPRPDTYAYAAERLGVPSTACVVVEDAVSGVRAGAAGDFGLVLGVDRGAGRQALLDGGADEVVEDLADTL